MEKILDNLVLTSLVLLTRKVGFFLIGMLSLQTFLVTGKSTAANPMHKQFMAFVRSALLPYATTPRPHGTSLLGTRTKFPQLRQQDRSSVKTLFYYMISFSMKSIKFHCLVSRQGLASSTPTMSSSIASSAPPGPRPNETFPILSKKEKNVPLLSVRIKCEYLVKIKQRPNVSQLVLMLVNITIRAEDPFHFPIEKREPPLYCRFRVLLRTAAPRDSCIDSIDVVGGAYQDARDIGLIADEFPYSFSYSFRSYSKFENRLAVYSEASKPSNSSCRAPTRNSEQASNLTVVPPRHLLTLPTRKLTAVSAGLHGELSKLGLALPNFPAHETNLELRSSSSFTRVVERHAQSKRESDAFSETHSVQQHALKTGNTHRSTLATPQSRIGYDIKLR
ncbi:hypothetical protein EAG_15347 [Camponotus floridanus]|uniref:Uncharacterized protein n=1 Tax=Camponotus floridanus TaxID=104421 RepID=E2AYU7_CAMFO|nr:hypothetical protein EAG_15347 [Camponotus floridanus]